MYNLIMLYGRLTANPDLRTTTGGSTVCSFTVAVDRPKTKDGNQIADFIKCSAWNRTADMVAKYFTKGKPIIVTGRLQNNDYTDVNGVKHHSYVVLVSNVSFSISDSTQQRGSVAPQPPVPQSVYQQSYPTYQSPRTAQPPLFPNEDLSLGNPEDFEEILSDGAVPF